jgi:hypothetical protein
MGILRINMKANYEKVKADVIENTKKSHNVKKGNLAREWLTRKVRRILK